MNVTMNLLWAIVGFAGGYGCAELSRKVEEMDSATTRGRRRKWHPKKNDVIGILVIVVAIVSSALYVQQSRELAAITKCQSRFNEQFNNALDVRSVASGQQNQTAIAHLESEKNLLVTLLGVAGPEQRRTALEDFIVRIDARIAALRQLEDARAQYPLPDLEACDP
jgi:hypothetical protein